MVEQSFVQRTNSSMRYIFTLFIISTGRFDNFYSLLNESGLLCN